MAYHFDIKRPVHVFVLKVVLVLLISISTSSGLTIQERLQIIEDNYNEMKTELEGKVLKLESRVRNLEEEIGRLEPKTIKASLHIASQKEMRQKPVYRTCSEIGEADSSLTSGMYWIDPDGIKVGEDPIYVFCDMTTGLTSVMHDSEAQNDVGNCDAPGCYSRTINYNATMRQMEALASISKECQQSIRYDCVSAPFEFGNIAYSWWNDRNGNPQYFWSGIDNSTHTCQCGIDDDGSTCHESFLKCNCDSNLQAEFVDRGIIKNKNLLPITRLNFGRTSLKTSSGLYTLGRFECTGVTTLSRMPSSCADLWWIGHSLSGLYSVMGATQVESVYCDFTKLLADSGFQTRIGHVDIKSSPVYFYVQRNSGFSTHNVSIPFQLARLNVGGAMNLSSGIFTAPRSGIYFFSFSGISDSGDYLNIGLYVNGKRIGSGHSTSTHDTLAIHSTLNLNAGDQVSLRIWHGQVSLHDHIGRHYTHFTGWLLEEFFSS